MHPVVVLPLGLAVFQGNQVLPVVPPTAQLSAWERQVGWELLADGRGTGRWEPEAPDRLQWTAALGPFELELSAEQRGAGPEGRRRVRVIVDARGLEVWDGTLHLEPVEVRADSDVQLGRIRVRKTSDERAPFQLALDTREDAFSEVRRRGLDTQHGTPVEIFDGKSLAGWRPIGDARWSVEKGELVGAVGGGSQSFLVTERAFGDFTLEVDVKNELPGNSGIQVRSHQNEQGRVYGYQIEIDPSARAWSGGLYDEGRRAWLQNLEHSPGRGAFKPGEWNHYRIEGVGPHLRTWVNGAACVDFLDALDHEGFIGLQVHSGQDTKVRWRNFRLSTHGAGTEVPVELGPGQGVSSWSADLGPDYVLHAEWDGSKLPAGWMLKAGGRIYTLDSEGWGAPEVKEQGARVLHVIKAGSRFKVGTDRSTWHAGAIEDAPTYVLLEAGYSTSTPPAGLKLTVRGPPKH